MKSKLVWHDGQYVPWDEATVSAFSHGMQRGASVFDVGAFALGKTGFHLFRGRDHVERFVRSANAIGLSIVHSIDHMLEVARNLASRSGHDAGLVRWTAAVPTVQPDVVPIDTQACVSIAAYAPTDLWLENLAPKRPDAYAVQIATTIRKAPPEVLPPHVKVSASYLGPMLARRRALEQGFNEVLLCNLKGFILEAPTSNVFWVKDGVLRTPPGREVLLGITRESVIAIAAFLGIPFEEAPLTSEALRSADEAFLTATSYPLMPIARVDDCVFDPPLPGDLTVRIRDALVAAIAGEPSPFCAWCD